MHAAPVFPLRPVRDVRNVDCQDPSGLGGMEWDAGILYMMDLPLQPTLEHHGTTLPETLLEVERFGAWKTVFLYKGVLTPASMYVYSYIYIECHVTGLAFPNTVQTVFGPRAMRFCGSNRAGHRPVPPPPQDQYDIALQAQQKADMDTFLHEAEPFGRSKLITC